MKDPKVDEYIAKQPSPQKEICQTLRNIIFKTFPNIEEKMKWGVPTYCEGKYYIVALKTHVNVGFAIEGLAEEEVALFQGKGDTMRTIKIDSKTEIDENYLVQLLKLIH